MKFYKRILEKLDMPAYPEGVKGNAPTVARAEILDYMGEPLLVVTVWDRAAKRPYCRVFAKPDGTHLIYDCFWRKWLGKTLCSMTVPNSRYSLLACGGNVNYVSDADEQAGKQYLNSKVSCGAIQDIKRAYSTKKWVAQKKQKKIAAGQGGRNVGEIIAGLPEIPSGALEYALEEGPLRNFRFLFFRTEKGRNPLTGLVEKRCVGYCTHCHGEYELLFEPIHKGEYTCPGCGSKVISMADRYKHGKLLEWEKMALFQKTPEGHVYVRLLSLCLDYRREYRANQPRCYTDAVYFFAPGEGCQLKPESCWENKPAASWRQIQRVCSLMEYFTGDRTWPLPDGWFDDTCLRHAHLEDFVKINAYYPMEYLAAYSKKPGLEHLMGAGLRAFVLDAVQENWYVKRISDFTKLRPRDILGVSQPEIELFARHNWNAAVIFGYRCCRRAGFFPTEDDMRRVAQFQEMDKKLYREEMSPATVRVLLQFLRRQENKRGEVGMRMILADWKDYVEECARLQYDLNDPAVKYPHDLAKAHQKTSALIQAALDEETRVKDRAEQKKYARRLEWLENFCWEDRETGLLIRPARSRRELVHEGEKLNHCVGMYADRHLRGDTSIFLIRQADQPDTPYFTLEFRDAQIIQNRGRGNCAPPEAVREFAKRWLHDVALHVPPMRKKKQKNRVRVA